MKSLIAGVAAMLVLATAAAALAQHPIRVPGLGSAVADEPDYFQGLSFRVGQTERLKVAGRVRHLVVLTESGALRPQGADACVFVVGRSLAEVRIGDPRAFAEQRVHETERVSNIRIARGRELVIAGLPAYEIVADATDPATGRALTIYQLLLLDGATHFLMEGLVVERRADAMVPEFQRVAASFAKTYD